MNIKLVWHIGRSYIILLILFTLQFFFSQIESEIEININFFFFISFYKPIMKVLKHKLDHDVYFLSTTQQQRFLYLCFHFHFINYISVVSDNKLKISTFSFFFYVFLEEIVCVFVFCFLSFIVVGLHEIR